ncbi:MAG: WecB/TagA/CpsF family glycosyltransferase [Acidimicrobiia bacterium]|nr:WecB/TagA/CpsF family glycosyltransferase [Acidimicrobiia bacterium]
MAPIPTSRDGLGRVAERPPDDDVNAARPRGAVDGLVRRRLFGLDFVDAPSLGPVVDAILADADREVPGAIGPGPLPIVVTPNVDILVSLDRDPAGPVAEIYGRARYVLPDGMPVVVASRILRRPLSARLPGSGLFELLWPRLVAEARAAVVLCANETIAERLGHEHPGARFLVPGFIAPDDDEQLSIVAKELYELAAQCEAEFVLLGLGHPKDALVMGRLQRLWRNEGAPGALSLGLGGSFAMHVGQKKRAPALLQRAGLEWFYRFLQEPRRLFRRYFVDDLAFIGIVRRERRALAEPSR